ncbi:hypothetical protein DD238_001136 [Peronospora effusa]|uniref:Uncharacterized protein n=1 Tax=Peronospora effusa TaxID=542832 RepID=A0A3M6VLR7_9STRA|nr:hypothetical protein DD238_001136 [Peronospora effusa]RQM13852.1 hypothetical protein DD237_002017 [Peronospora effusa]
MFPSIKEKDQDQLRVKVLEVRYQHLEKSACAKTALYTIITCCLKISLHSCCSSRLSSSCSAHTSVQRSDRASGRSAVRIHFPGSKNIK